MERASTRALPHPDLHSFTGASHHFAALRRSNLPLYIRPESGAKDRVTAHAVETFQVRLIFSSPILMNSVFGCAITSSFSAIILQILPVPRLPCTFAQISPLILEAPPAPPLIPLINDPKY